ncbi:MAG: hypothetical protein OXT67_01710 [Zetaproteobacteria bacterium]|nr:hypothetical protein [Zetaproteobacteria bacterium]
MVYWAQIAEFLEKLTKFPWRGTLVAAAVGFLVASVGALAVQIFLYATSEPFMQSRKARRVAANTTSDFALGSTLDRNGIEAILTRNLFNKDGVLEEETDEEEESSPVEDSDLLIPKSDLDIKILGIIFGGDPRAGVVTLQNKGSGLINTFLVDEFITGDAQLQQVLRNRIIVYRNGRQEYLEMDPPPELKDKQRTRVKGGKVRTLQPAAKSKLDKFSEPGFERNGNDITLSSDYRKKLLTTDFTKVLQDAKAEPNLVGGELDGFRLTRIRTDSIYEKSGLQNGDVIKEINGVSLVDTAQTIKLLNSLRSASEIEVRINRGSANFVKLIQVR